MREHEAEAGPELCFPSRFPSLVESFFPFGEKSASLFQGVRWGPEATRRLWTHSGRCSSSGLRRFVRWNLMGDPQGTVEGVNKSKVLIVSTPASAGSWA